MARAAKMERNSKIAKAKIVMVERTAKAGRTDQPMRLYRCPVYSAPRKRCFA
jgi:hypothetical protein